MVFGAVAVLAEPSKLIANAEQFTPVTATQDGSLEGMGVEVKLATGGLLVTTSVIGDPALMPEIVTALGSTNLMSVRLKGAPGLGTGFLSSNATLARRFPYMVCVVVIL